MEVRDFSKVGSTLPIPDLLQVQTNSFKNFLQADTPSELRKNTGLQAVFNRTFPIEDIHDKFRLEFINYRVAKPRYTPSEAQQRGATYSAPLKVTLRLVSRTEDGTKDAVEQEIFLCDIPLISERGTFIVNGVERVIVTQLHRSPGVYFSEDIHPSGKKLHTAQILPYRGAWIQFLIDASDILVVSLNRRPKLPVTSFLLALGYSREDIINMFYKTETVKISKKVVGRYLARNTLNILAGTKLTEENVAQLSEKLKKIEVVVVGDPLVLNTIRKTGELTNDEAVEKVYVRLRATTPPDVESAKIFLRRMFFDPRIYDIATVGRYKINSKLSLNISLDTTTLTDEDIIETIRYIIKLRRGKGGLDDIDHLGNRRCRTVGEQLENQFNIGLSRMARNIRERMSLAEPKDLTPADLVNPWIVYSVILNFFSTAQLSQFMEQTNPLAELTHKRRLSCIGPGSLRRETAGFEVRDVHYSHYGRICPVETPEGPNIGLMTSLTTYATIDDYGFIVSPYRKVKNSVVKNEVVYLNASEEDKYIIAQANAPLDSKGRFARNVVLSREKGDFPTVSPSDVDFMDVSPKQMVSPATSLIPFLEHDDANRALMGANMQRQAVPLLTQEFPLVSTGMEEKVAKDSGAVMFAEEDGVVEKVTSEEIRIKPTGKDKAKVYKLIKFKRTNQDTCINQRPIVKLGEKVKKGDVIADGSATENGVLALGKNILVAFMPWKGYNFEDAIVVSEKLLKNDTLTSIYIKEFETGVRETKLGPEEITREIPNVAEDALKNLDSEGIVRIGAKVGPDDVLVGKVTPKGETALTPEERLLRAIFGEKAADVKDSSLRLPAGTSGVVIDVRILSRNIEDKYSKDAIRTKKKKLKDEVKKEQREIIANRNRKISKLLTGKIVEDTVRDEKGEILMRKKQQLTSSALKKLDFEKLEINKNVFSPAIYSEIVSSIKEARGAISELEEHLNVELEKLSRGDELPHGVQKVVKVYVAQRRVLQVGDKLAGRHGNKGVISKIAPEEDMPFLSDGTPIDILLNPLSVPSRMNVGQILETHLGWAAKKLGVRIITPVFEGATIDETKAMLSEAGLPPTGKTYLRSGDTGERYESDITVGYIYTMKLSHMVEDKIHARSTGPYSLITQQPLGGKAQFGGQRFGEMEVWALEAYGAAYTLQELLTVKSDDVVGRSKLYEAIIKGEHPPQPGIPASFDVLVKELNGLCIDVELLKEEV